LTLPSTRSQVTLQGKKSANSSVIDTPNATT